MAGAPVFTWMLLAASAGGSYDIFLGDTGYRLFCWPWRFSQAHGLSPTAVSQFRWDFLALGEHGPTFLLTLGSPPFPVTNPMASKRVKCPAQVIPTSKRGSGDGNLVHHPGFSENCVRFI